MPNVIALLRPDSSLLIAERRGAEWQIVAKPKDAGLRGRNLTVYVDGLDVLGLTANLPARNESEARKAAPFAIEDDIAEPAETVHVALDDPTQVENRARRTINVTSMAQMADWIEALTSYGYQDASIMSAHSTLPAANILIETPHSILGRINNRAFTLDASLGTDVLRGLISDVTELTVRGETLAAQLNLASVGPALSTEEAFLIWLGEQSDESQTGINLRQGAYQVRRPVDLSGAKQWRLAGILAAAACVGWFATLMIETYAMERRTAELRRVASEFASTGWPESGGDVQRALVAAGAGNSIITTGLPSALTASSILYEALGTVPGAEIRSLRYDQGRGRLNAVIAFKDFADADRLATAVQERGLSAITGDARQSGDRVVGDLTIGRVS